MTVRKWGNETIVADANGSQFLSNDKGLDITTLSDGSYIVSWIQQDGFIVQAQKFNAAGQAVGGIFEIGASVTGASKTDIVLAATGDGGFAAAFTNGANSGDSWYEQFDDNANVVRTTQWDLSSNAQAEQDPSIAIYGDYIFLAESDSFSDGNVYLQMRKFSDGTAANINGASTFITLNGDLATGSQSAVNIAFSGQAAIDHNMAAVWADFGTNTLRLRIFNVGTATVIPTVTAVTASLDIAGDVGSMDFAPQVVGLANGGFAVVWHDSSGSGSPDTSSYGVRAKIYSSDGVALTGEITVNSIFNGLQARPDVVALRDGGFLVTFDDKSTGDRNISGQMFDAFGNRVGGQFTVNTHSAGSDYDSRITELEDGRIVVVWTNQDDGIVRQQIIDPRDGVVDGTGGTDVLYGHDAFGDILSGLAGDDTMNGLAGNDVGYGAEGDDRFNGGRGDDTAYGGAGNDDLRGDGGEDVLSGGIGNDVLRGGRADDELDGGEGNDTLVGNAGADALSGGLGNDTASYSDANAGVATSLDGSVAQAGDAAGDTYSAVENIVGSNFADTISGSSGANTLEGRNSADVLDGKAGADRMIGGEGGDTLTGGTGSDKFVFNAPGEGGDVIVDYSQVSGNNDSFELKASGFGGGLVAGPLLANQFQDNNTSAAANGNVRVIYNQSTGELFFDADGDGGGAAVLLATLTNNANLGLGDFTIV